MKFYKHQTQKLYDKISKKWKISQTIRKQNLQMICKELGNKLQNNN